MTHAEYIEKVRTLAVARLTDDAARMRLTTLKLVYGKGGAGVRGDTHFRAWKNGAPEAVDFIEVAAQGEESLTQVAGTTIHELAHSLAGADAGHSDTWKRACFILGLRRVHAAGTKYLPANFDLGMRLALAALPSTTDGKPAFWGFQPNPLGLLGFLGMPRKPRPCSLGIGTRGGKSRGVGSGSRLRKYVCGCTSPVVRVASDTWAATCNTCGNAFKRAE